VYLNPVDYMPVMMMCSRDDDYYFG